MVSASSSSLGVVVTAAYRATIGFGDVYECTVERVLTGALRESKLTLTVLAGADALSTFLAGHPPPRLVELRFTKLRDDEPYQTAPINGFVDDGATSWEISYVGEADPTS